MNNALIVLLILIALVMIVIGINASVLPPALTGIGFIIIGYLLFQKQKK